LIENHDIFNLKVMSGAVPLSARRSEPHEDMKSDAIEDAYANDRTHWTNKTISMAKKVERMINLAELEVDAFSSRGMAVESKHSYISTLTNLTKSYKLLEADKVKAYVNSGKKYTAEQMKTIISADISDLWAQIEHLKAHVSFMDETIKTIDNIIYGVKYRIEIQKYLDPTK
jgi:hypothetical protein